VIHGDVLGERARLTPDKLALVTVPGGLRLTYRELDDGARGCAAGWRTALGLTKGERIAILAHNRVEYVEAFFAAGKSGVILVTLGTKLTPVELSQIVEDSAPRALIYDGAFAETVASLRTRVDVEHWIALDQPVGADDPSFSEMAAAAGSGTVGPPAAGPEDVHCLLYTSGTTGAPKGVCVPHRMVSWNALSTVCGWQLLETDVSPVFTPIYHAGGLMAFLTPIFAIGGTIVLHRGFDVSEIWRTIEHERCTVVLGVPTIWKLLMEAPEFASADLSHVRWFISGGAPLPEYIIRAYQEKGVVFKQGYGMTEVGVNCFAMTVQDSFDRAGSIGKPMMFTEVRLADEHGHEVATGDVGEMLFRGPHVSSGYWNQPEATAASYDPDGWFHSGDLARQDGAGFFYIAGRKKDMIISGGVNVYPAEIETALLQHPGIEDTAVVGVPDDTWGEVGVAFVVCRADEALSQDEIVGHLAGCLARFKIPKAIRVLDHLPRTVYGKVKKSELRDRYLSEIG
jgi:fatty-acyl-CoA synthase